MKRNFELFVMFALVLAVVALLVFPIGKRFTLPFAAEDVSSVILWSFWGYKETAKTEDIAMIVKEMNNAHICGEFDYEDYEPREGDYSCNASFFLKDGSTYKYSTMPKPGLTSIFQDSDGTYYKAKYISLERIYNNLRQEPKPGNPFE